MDAKKYDFLRAVVGDDGASALRKAADRLGDLEGAIVPRAIMAWLGVAARGDYEGSIPGVQDSYLDFAKNEDGTYSGSITIGEGVFPFQNATVFHLAASISVALGAQELDDDSRFKNMDLVKLGKSIDIMAKAKFISNAEDLAKDLVKAVPGPPHAPTLTGVPQIAVAPVKQVDKGPQPPPGQKPKKPPTEAKVPKATVPKLKVKIPKNEPGGGKKFLVSDTAAKSECGVCGLPLIKNEKFSGCMCFKETARYVTLTKNAGKTYINFSRSVDDDAIAAILDTLGVNRHG